MESVRELIYLRANDPRSTPGIRSDNFSLALAIEGGGMSGAVSGGMCVFLEEAGYLRSFDNIYGCSAGALNGSYMATGQAREGVDNYLEMSGRLFRFSRLMRKQFPLALDELFEQVIKGKRPIDFSSYSGAPSFHALVLSLKDYSIQARSDFSSGDDMMQLVRASCTMPLIAGRPFPYKGDMLLDGGLIESIPFAAALRGGATHVLVLRSQSKEYKKSPYHSIFHRTLSLYNKRLSEILLARPIAYNQEADALLSYNTGIGKHCQQITIKEDLSRGTLALDSEKEEVATWIDMGYKAAEEFFS